MKKLKLKLIPTQTHQYFEGDGEGGAAAGAGAGTGGAGTGGTGAGGTEKTFTEAQVNSIVSDRVKRMKEENGKLLKQLQSIQTNGMSPEAREALETQITTLEASLLTTQEVAEKRQKELQDRYSNELKGVSTERDTWRARYETSLIQAELAKSAAEAENPEQISMMFGPNSYVAEIKDDAGKPTGQFQARLKFVSIDPESKNQVQLDLPIGEALSRIKTDGLHKNLFKHSSKGGTGTPVGGGSDSANRMPTLEQFGGDVTRFNVAWAQWRKKYDLDGSERKAT